MDPFGTQIDLKPQHLKAGQVARGQCQERFDQMIGTAVSQYSQKIALFRKPNGQAGRDLLIAAIAHHFKNMGFGDGDLDFGQPGANKIPAS